MEEMDGIDAHEEPWDIIGEYLTVMLQRTTRDNPVTGKVNNTEHGNIRVVMFIEDNDQKKK